MLNMSYIDELVKAKLDDLTHQSEILKQRHVGLSISKDSKRILIFHQSQHSLYPNTVYVYRKADVWVLEYYLPIDPPTTLKHYTIDAWLDPCVEGFTVKLGSLEDERDGITYRYLLKDDEYQLAVTSTNTRVVFNEQPYFIEGAF